MAVVSPAPNADARAQPEAGFSGRARMGWAAGVAALLLVAFLGDALTGEDVSFSFFYVVGILVGSWFLGRNAGLVAAASSLIAWIGAYVLAGKPYSRPSVLYWNILVEGAIYLTVALAVARASKGLAKERELGARLSRAYEVLAHEMNSAGRLQQELLPQGPSSIEGYEAAQHYATSTRAGGDYYDYLRLPDGRVAVVVADASGHGVPAAVLMGMTLVLMRAAAESALRPDLALAQVNRRLFGTLPPGSFVTACYAVLDPRSGEVEYSLAGHDPPLVQHAAGECVAPLPLRGGPPLGLFAQFPLETGSTSLEPGDTLVLYTDGLTEAMNSTDELFGRERLIASLSQGGALPLNTVRERVLAEVDAYSGGTTLQDDLTLVLLRRSNPCRPVARRDHARTDAHPVA